MELASPVNPTHFDFNPSAYPPAPSTPASPARISELYRDFEELLISNDTRGGDSRATVPFAWEEKPGVPKSTGILSDNDFAFDVSSEFHPYTSVTADDLFHGGMIKPVGFAKLENERGRERLNTSSNLRSSRSRRTRSLPPVRGFEETEHPSVPTNESPTFSTCATLLSSGSGKGLKKWSFKDLFLFRSASDGRALDRDPLKKYSATFRKHDEDFRNSSLRDRAGSGYGSKRRGRVSAHELHYTVNRAVSNDMKKKTFLPYKQGILGRLAFNPTVHALSNGFGFSHNN